MGVEAEVKLLKQKQLASLSPVEPPRVAFQDDYLASERHYAEIVAAIELDRIDLLQVRLSVGFEMKTVDENENTVLHHACRSGSVDAVRCLHRNDASLTARNRYGFTPFLVAVHAGHEELVRMLVEELGVDYRDDYSDTQKQTYFRLTAMEIANLRGHNGICAYLLRAGHMAMAQMHSRGCVAVQRRPTILRLGKKR